MDFGMSVSWVVGGGLLAGGLAGFVMRGGSHGLIGDLLLLGACWTRPHNTLGYCAWLR